MVWGEEGQGLVSRTIAESVRMEGVEVSVQVFFCGSSRRHSLTDLTIALLHVRRTDHALK